MSRLAELVGGIVLFIALVFAVGYIWQYLDDQARSVRRRLRRR